MGQRKVLAVHDFSVLSLWFPVLPRMLLARCVNVFLEDLCMFLHVVGSSERQDHPSSQIGLS